MSIDKIKYCAVFRIDGYEFRAKLWNEYDEINFIRVLKENYRIESKIEEFQEPSFFTCLIDKGFNGLIENVLDTIMDNILFTKYDVIFEIAWKELRKQFIYTNRALNFTYALNSYGIQPLIKKYRMPAFSKILTQGEFTGNVLTKNYNLS